MKNITKKQLSDFNKIVVRIATELGFKEVPARIGSRKDYRIESEWNGFTISLETQTEDVGSILSIFGRFDDPEKQDCTNNPCGKYNFHTRLGDMDIMETDVIYYLDPAVDTIRL